MNEKTACACAGTVTLLIPCSGAADTGEIADRAARKFAEGGCAGMFCLAGVGANLSGFIASAKGADNLLVIDGCNLECARKVLEEKGITENITHVKVTDLGFAKGKSPASSGRIDAVVNEIGRKLTQAIRKEEAC